MENKTVPVLEVKRVLDAHKCNIDKLNNILQAHTFTTDLLENNPTSEAIDNSLKLLGLSISDIVSICSQLETNHARISKILDDAEICIEL